jgi:hypothetical protein
MIAEAQGADHGLPGRRQALDELKRSPSHGRRIGERFC